ncbi:MAG: ABC transporter substrate-binding protein [Armatimonadota bacterium]
MLRTVVAGIALVALIGVLGQAPTLTAVPASAALAADTIVVAKDLSDIKTPDPNKAYEISGSLLQYFTYSRLVQQRAPNYSQVIPDLAASWSISPDASVYTFKLRDAVFSTGNPVTAEDVRFSLLRVKNIKGYGAFLADPIKSVETVGDKTVRIILTGPNAAFLAALAGNVFAIVDAKTVRAQGGVETQGADKLDKAEEWFYTHSAGAGPYVLRRYARESEIVFERNDKYYGEKPFFRQVIIKHVKDPATQTLMMQRGDADVALDLTIDQVESLKGKPNITIHRAVTLVTVYFGLNASIKPWDNPKVREAVKYAIDYEGIQKTLMRGSGKLVATPVSVGVAGMTDALNQQLRYKQNLAKARALLKEAGYTGGLRPKFMFETGASHGTLSNDQLAQKLQSDLAKVGLTLDLQPLSSSIFLSTYRQRKAETVIGTWNPDFIDPDNWSYFVSGFINKRLHWESPAGKKLVEEALRTPTGPKRVSLYQQYYRVLAAPASPFVGLVQTEVAYPTRSNIENFKHHPLYFFEIHSASRK